MEYTGLVQKFKVNRPLTDEERARRLEQRKRLDIKPEHQLSVIRLNSTFLEVVDVYFAWKGAIAFMAVAGWVMTGGLWTYSAIREVVRPGPYFEWWDIALTFFVSAALAIAFAWLAYFECFRLTHYPIRFNRKTRKVHVFRTDGTVLTTDWERLFFCLGRCYQPRQWTIQGHVLAADGKTVVETFSLSDHGVGEADRDMLKHAWEYVRRYMADGPQSLADETSVVLPISNHRDTLVFSLRRLVARTSRLPFALLLPLLGFWLLFYPGRWLAMRTSKIPRWPAEIEAQCAIAPDDRYVRDVNTNPVWAR